MSVSVLLEKTALHVINKKIGTVSIANIISLLITILINAEGVFYAIQQLITRDYIYVDL